MGKFIDLTGMRFGKCVANTLAGYRDGRILWECKCDCGKTFVTLACTLRGGLTKSCGCYNKQRVSETKSLKLTGKRFGYLTVMRKYEGKIRNNNRVSWECKCDCGNECVKEGVELKNKHITSCGPRCKIKRKAMSDKFFIDLTGKKFDRWTVISRHKTNGLGGRVRYNCKCDCGTVKVIDGARLKNKSTRSCGCYRAEYLSHKLRHDLTGKRFGKLVVLKLQDDKKWLCKCDCGAFHSVVASVLTRKIKTKSCGCYAKQKTSETRSLKLKTGAKYGFLTVIKRVSPIGAQLVKWECKCRCGNTTIVAGSRLKSESTLSCGCIGSLITRARNKDPQNIAKCRATQREKVWNGTHHALKHGRYTKTVPY